MPTTEEIRIRETREKNKLLDQGDDSMIEYGEVISYAPEQKITGWGWLPFVQLINLLFFFVYMIFFLLETQYVRFTNVYAFFISFWVIGGVIWLAQLIAAAFFWYHNRRNANAKRSANEGGYMGLQFSKEVQQSVMISSLCYIIITWQTASWISQFHKTTGNSDPNVGVEPEWRIFITAYVVAFLASLVAIVFLIRATVANFNPTRVITPIYQKMEK